MADIGIVGVRIDAAKHQDAGELSGITKRFPSSLYVNQEVWLSEPLTLDVCCFCSFCITTFVFRNTFR
jgi:hypothetical protein